MYMYFALTKHRKHKTKQTQLFLFHFVVVVVWFGLDFFVGFFFCQFCFRYSLGYSGTHYVVQTDLKLIAMYLLLFLQC